MSFIPVIPDGMKDEHQVPPIRMFRIPRGVQIPSSPRVGLTTAPRSAPALSSETRA